VTAKTLSNKGVTAPPEVNPGSTWFQACALEVSGAPGRAWLKTKEVREERRIKR